MQVKLKRITWNRSFKKLSTRFGNILFKWGKVAKQQSNLSKKKLCVPRIEKRARNIENLSSKAKVLSNMYLSDESSLLVKCPFEDTSMTSIHVFNYFEHGFKGAPSG